MSSSRRRALAWLLLALTIGGVAIAAWTEAGVFVPPRESTPVANDSHPASADGRIALRAGERLRITGPDGRIREVHSLLAVSGPQSYGSFTWKDVGDARQPVWVRVDLEAQTISAFRGGDEIGTAVILHGAGDKPTPTGWFTVLEKKRDHYSRSYDAPMPWMLRLTTDGVALHESHVVPGRATHGCIGLPEDFARKLYAAMRPGDPVLIVAGTPAKS